jgi:putative peptidoglycan lipid II flippase
MEANNRDFSQNSKNSAVIMICTALSRLLGIVRISMVSRIFGAGGTADVINFTFNIPNNFRKLLAEGALSSAFIPTLTKAIKDDPKRKEERLLVRQMLFLQLLIFIPLIVLSFIFNRQIIGFLSDFDSADASALAAVLLPLFVLYLALVSYISVMNAVLNSNGLFVLAAVAPLSYSVAVIISLYLFSGSLGAFSFPLGVLVGGLIQLGMLMIRLKHIGYSILPKPALHSRYVRQIGANYLPVMAASLITIVNQQVTFFLASGLDTGSVTTFSNAIIFYQLPYGLFFNAAATVYFPKMSASFHAAEKAKTSEYVSKASEYLFVFLLPSALLLFILSQELVASILFRGAYRLEDTLLTARIVRMLAVGLVPTALFGLLQRFFYAAGQFRTSLKITIITALVDVTLSVASMISGFDVAYLALAHTVSFSIGTVIMVLVMIRRHMVRINLPSITISAGKIILLNIPMVMYLIGIKSVAGVYWGGGTSLLTILLTVGISLVAGLILLFSYTLGKVEHITVFFRKADKS